MTVSFNVGMELIQPGADALDVLRDRFLIGSPETVAAKIEKTYKEVGGFGHLLMFCFDYADNPEPWRRSMELLATEVMPRVAHLEGD